MGGGSSKWRRISMGPPEPGECREASWPEEGGGGQRPGQEGEGGDQQRPAKTGRTEGGNSQLHPGTRSEDGRQSPAADCNIEQELDRALAECEDRFGSDSNPPNNPRNQQNLRHDLLTISTQDIENNNFANGFHINGKNPSPNSAPILYDYSEEELMASIEKEYS